MSARALLHPLSWLIDLFRGGRFCAHDYWEDRHRSFRGKLRAVGHAQLDERANAEQYEVKRARIAQVLAKHVVNPQGRTLLDAGCGIGLLTSAFVDLGFDVTGADVSRTGIAEARSREVRARFVVSAIETLELARTFDVVAIVDVLLHVVEREAWVKSLGALSRHVRPGGLLVIVDSMRRVEHDKPVHCTWRTLEDFTETMAAFGLTRIDHVQFDLMHEGSTKDIAVFRR